MKKSNNLNLKKGQDGQLIITISCIYCHKQHDVVVKEEDYKKWISGEYVIQKCFPYLTPGDREILISGVCNDCFNKYFSDED